MKKNIFIYFILIFILNIIGIVSIYFSSSIIDSSFYLKKQIIYSIIGVICLLFFSFINIKYIFKYSLFFYIFTILLLFYVLFFGNTINGSRSWISLFGISFQPSEFCKITLLLCFYKYINTKYGLFKCFILLLIPSILTFLQPDTGTVIFYLVMYFFIFLFNNYKKKYYIYTFSILVVCLILFFILYFFKNNLFIKLFGTSFFYRIDRLINFKNNSGFQINNALIGIGNSGLFGNLGKYVVYIPEAVTDFAFANFLMNFGYIFGIVLLVIYLILDFLFIKDINKIRKYRIYIIGFFGLFLYQQIQHIFMNIGLLPITGITLPFISYGGSSLISYYILFGILFNIKRILVISS